MKGCILLLFLMASVYANTCSGSADIAVGKCSESCASESYVVSTKELISVYLKVLLGSVTVKALNNNVNVGQKVLTSSGKVPIELSDVFTTLQFCNTGTERAYVSYDMQYEPASMLRERMIGVIVGGAVGGFALFLIIGIIAVVITSLCKTNGGGKSVLVAYILWFFFGYFGVHRFYLNRPLSGIIYLLTGGIFGIGFIIDICLIPVMVEDENKAAIRASAPTEIIISHVNPNYVPPPSSEYSRLV